jgi:hypothetical protein
MACGIGKETSHIIGDSVTVASKARVKSASIGAFSGSTLATKLSIPCLAASVASQSIIFRASPRPWSWSATTTATSARPDQQVFGVGDDLALRVAGDYADALTGDLGEPVDSRVQVCAAGAEAQIDRPRGESLEETLQAVGVTGLHAADEHDRAVSECQGSRRCRGASHGHQSAATVVGFSSSCRIRRSTY